MEPRGPGFETSLSSFDGFNNLPNIVASDVPAVGLPPAIDVTRVYPAIRSYGADAAVPLRWLTIRGEASYFTSSTPEATQARRSPGRARR
jgi:hypothetical protein